MEKAGYMNLLNRVLQGALDNKFDFFGYLALMPRYPLILVSSVVIMFIAIFINQAIDLLYLDLCLLYLYVLTSIIYLKKIPRTYQYLLLMLMSVLALEIASYFMAVIYRNNHPIYHLTVPVQIGVFGLIFRKTLFPKGRNSNYTFLIVCLILLSLLNSLFLQDLSTAPSYGMLLLSFFVITSSLFQFKLMLTKPTHKKLTLRAIFWFCIASFLFYTLTFVSFGLHAILLEDLPQFVFDFIMWFNLVLYFLYFVAIYLSTKSKPLTNDAVG